MYIYIYNNNNINNTNNNHNNNRKRYYKRGFNLKSFGVESTEGLISLIKDTAEPSEILVGFRV